MRRLATLALIAIAALLPTPRVSAPEARWLDSRHVLISWQQDTPADMLCVGRIASDRGNYVLIGCGPASTGPQQLILPIAGTHDAETEPLEGDVYLVGDQRTAPLGPVPHYGVLLPLVRR